MMPDFYTFDRLSRESFTLSRDSINTLQRIMEKDAFEEAQENPVEEGFGALMMKALGNVNNAQNKVYDMQDKLRTEPNSINIHDLTIASAEATLALSMTKELVERAIRAYKEVINVR
ncbi:MAG: flagellar hook-basal body complex protein FliE [Spirochaetaceae bacterium]|nr:MAG: flagellar hook-basal body complex protein FliE [Spirochaetaceae bacterium]